MLLFSCLGRRLNYFCKSRKGSSWGEENFRIFLRFLIHNTKTDKEQNKYFVLVGDYLKKNPKPKPTKTPGSCFSYKRIKQMWPPFLCLTFLTSTLIQMSISGLCQLIMFKCKTENTVPKIG